MTKIGVKNSEKVTKYCVYKIISILLRRVRERTKPIIMLERKFEDKLKEMLQKQIQKTEPATIGLDGRKIPLINGARQIGKSYLIRYVGKKMFRHFIEIDLKADKDGEQVFTKVRSKEDFYMQVSAIAGSKLNNRTDTLIFLDEIQSYPHLMTMLKFLNQDGRYSYIASGSQLGVALSQTASVPIGSIDIEQMYPLDFEEFLWAMDCGKDVTQNMRQCFEGRQPISEALHDLIMRLFRYYLITGGLPDAVNRFAKDKNIQVVRDIQRDIHRLYGIDASQYDEANKLKIRRVYDLLPSTLENKKKRIIIKDIEHKAGKQYSDYAEEFEYLIESGIALEVRAISNPRFPLSESETKSLLKLYMNDVGIISSLLYGFNINAIIHDEKSINLGTVYESVVAQELHAHGFRLHYYDNKKRGEVDFLVDDFKTLSVLPIEVKSGKDYKVHSALSSFIATDEYNIKSAIVFCNDREVKTIDNIVYMPIYYCMFLTPQPPIIEL